MANTLTHADKTEPLRRPVWQALSRAERWVTSQPVVPALVREWRALSRMTKLSFVFASLFFIASMTNLVFTGVTRSGAAPAAPAPSAAALAREAAPPDAGRTWVAKKIWQGTGARDTEEFVVGEHWRVDWIFNPGRAGGIVQVFIYRVNGTQYELLDIAANTDKAGTDSSFWVGPGKYFLRVNATGGDWKLAVQDLR